MSLKLYQIVDVECKNVPTGSFHSGKDTDSSAMEEEDDVKALEAKIRCMGMKKKPSQGISYIVTDWLENMHIAQPRTATWHSQ